MLAACQSATIPSEQTTRGQAPTPGALTTEDARAAVRRYLGTQPDSALYVLPSASILDADGSWQVLVPRTDWTNRMPNKAAFDVDKATGTVTRRAVK
ncbi:hypothetical protein A8B98_09015 [Hymenobacter sp. UV11]|nr:hypothetical protein A8B98_09015 [Hymenobacter sp. UV11]